MTLSEAPDGQVSIATALDPVHIIRLRHLVHLGYGLNEADVARYLILRGLDDLLRTGIPNSKIEADK